MSRSEFIQSFIFFLLILISSGGLGIKIIGLIDKFIGENKKRAKIYSIEIIGASLLIGLGSFGYVSLIIGLLGEFDKRLLLSSLFLLALLSLKEIKAFLHTIFYHFKNLIKKYKKEPIASIAIIIAAVVLASLYLASMQPPHASDELHYHFPQVRQIVNEKKISLVFGGHPFYGNIPKLMEVLFATGTAISGYPLAHAFNYLLLIGFLLVVFGIINKHYGIRAASFSILLLAFFDDFTWNATTGYIDAATTGLEISSLLFIAYWLLNKEKRSLLIGGALMGLALSVKYSPLPTAAFSLLLITAGGLRAGYRRPRIILEAFISYGATAFIFGAFWYIKNFIFFLNPFYPLYFGHHGYEEQSYTSLVKAIQQFGPKTAKNYFYLTKRYFNITNIAVFISIYAAPFSLMVNRAKKLHYTLLAYFILYNIYWFFFTTHQIRFLMPALVVSAILLAIIFSKIKDHLLLKTAALILLFSLLISKFVRPIDYLVVWQNFWNAKFHLRERQYALGNISRSEFLRRQFGCQYKVIEYLKEHNLNDRVIDNWSVWHAPSVSFFAKEGQFTTYGLDINMPLEQISNKIREDKIKYIYFDTEVKKEHLANLDPIVVESKKTKLPSENFLLENSLLVYTEGNCKLYEVQLPLSN